MIYEIAATPRDVLWGLADYFQSRRSLREENARLLQENLVIQGQAQRLVSVLAENAYYRVLLNASKAIDVDVMVAEVVSISADPARHLLVLDKGSNQGVFKGQSLLGAEGLMGQIVLVGANSSRAMLITDAAHAVPVQVNRSGVRALTEGVGNINELIVRHVATTTDIKVDDVLVTSGLAGRFPPGYPVAPSRGRLRRILAPLSPPSLRARSRNSIAAVTFCSPRLRWPALLVCREYDTGTLGDMDFTHCWVDCLCCASTVVLALVSARSATACFVLLESRFTAPRGSVQRSNYRVNP